MLKNNTSKNPKLQKLLIKTLPNSHSTKNFENIGKPRYISIANQTKINKWGEERPRPPKTVKLRVCACLQTTSTKKNKNTESNPCINRKLLRIVQLVLDNKNKKIIIIFISCTVANAIKRFISNNDHIRDDASHTPHNTNDNARLKPMSKYKKKNNCDKQKKAVFTKKPLKNIEKPVGASTCTFVNQ